MYQAAICLHELKRLEEAQDALKFGETLDSSAKCWLT